MKGDSTVQYALQVQQVQSCYKLANHLWSLNIFYYIQMS